MTVAQRKKAHELRKTLKPLMEKRRRARINESLNHLKTLILPLFGKDASRYSKLEKADILEMTVRFLRDLPSSSAKDSYKEGYKACLQRISAMLPQSNLETETRQRVNEFLQHSMVSATSSCQNCCAQNSRMISQMHQRLVSLRNSSSATENHSISTAAAPSQPQPVPQAAVDMWRPW
uniref:Transcription factor HES-2-like n=1 Tax=Sinocyclocheilus rhinocerous TaxID=307959 RepID=A0A673GGD3_9TELE